MFRIMQILTVILMLPLILVGIIGNFIYTGVFAGVTIFSDFMDWIAP